jgi:hypothetical protein
MVATMDILSSLKFKRSELLKVAEDVCLALAEDPRSVDPSDRVIFQELGWNDRDIAREIGRCQSLKKWKREAGTNGQYADSIEQLDAVSKTVPKKVAELQVKIDELLVKIADEKAKLTNAEKVVAGYENARKLLRQSVPDHVKNAFNDEVSRIRSTRSAERMRELQARKRTVVGVLERLSIVNGDTIAPIRLHAEGARIVGIIPEPSPHWNQDRGINEAIWHEYLDRLRLELPTIESELLELEADFDEQLAEAETILDFYITEGK